MDQPGRLGALAFGDRGQFGIEHGAQASRRTQRFFLTDGAAHGVQPGPNQLLGIKRRPAGEQFVEQHAQAVDVAPRIDVQSAHLRLLGAHVSGRADKLAQLGIDGQVRQPAFRGFGDAKINDLRHRQAIMQRNQDVRGFDVAVNDALLMGVLDRMADLDEQRESLSSIELILIAVVGDSNTAHQFHHEVGAARLGCAGVQDPGNVGMVHHRQRLALGLNPGDHTAGVHAELDHLEGHPATNGLCLFGDIDHAATAFAEFLADLIVRDHIARFLGRRSGQHRRAVWARGRCGLKEFSSVVVRPEQELKALTQLRILAARLVEAGWALFGWQRQHGIEDGLLAARFGGRRRRGLLIVFHRGQHSQNLRMWKVVSVESRERRRQGAAASLVRNFSSAGNKLAPRCQTALASSARPAF